MNIENKKIGIWGLGVVGKSLVRFFASRGTTVQVMEKKILNQEEIDLLHKNAIKYIPEKHVDHFFENNDYVFVSPGIDFRPYRHFAYKIITELDLFYLYFKKPIIAITGTVGKTTITTLLAQSLQHARLRIASAGNIGMGLLDIIDMQESLDYAVIEVSSFQLEYTRYFAPHFAIITNIYPNHLDRHDSFESYVYAKLQIIKHGSAHQQILAHASIAPLMQPFAQRSTFFSVTKIDNVSPLFFVKENIMCFYDGNLVSQLCSLQNVPGILIENQLCIASALLLLSLSVNHFASDFVPIEHRMEYVASISGVQFYNDSKATIPQATLQALASLPKPIILFLGGLSKGIHREPFVAQLKNSVRYILCFGAEAKKLSLFCRKYSISSIPFDTLEEAFAFCASIMRKGDAILFSPSGSSYDLFVDYKARGKRFKELVHALNKGEK